MSRFAARAGACLAALAVGCALAVPATVGAAARGTHRLTIQAAPNPNDAGDPVVIFGRFTGPNRANRIVWLWHRIIPARRFSPIQKTRTDAAGGYVFTRADGVVDSNRNWFVVVGRTRSRTVHERVRALVSLASPTGQATTNHPLTFTGRVEPARAGERVVLQRQVGAAGTRWHSIAGTRTRTAPDGSFTIAHRFRVPDVYTIRARFVGDRRDASSASDSIDVIVAQTTNPRLTLSSSADPITVGQSVTLSGTLAGANAAGKTVTLLARGIGGAFTQIASTPAGAGGGFSFVQVPAHTTVYEVRAAGRRSAQVFEPVRDIVNATADRPSVTSGQTVTFSGTVTPAHPGHEIALQHRGADGRWHTVETGTVSGAGSTFALAHVMHSPGTHVFRVRIDGGPLNWGGASAPIAIVVSPPAAP